MVGYGWRMNSPDPDSDATVIAASVEDPDRFGEVFDRYRDTMFRYVARRVGSQAAPDVTAQERP